jgi:hypothetical protein
MKKGFLNMNKPTRILFVVFAVFLFIHVGLSVAFSYEVYNTAAELRRQQTRDMLSLGARIEKAEAMIQTFQEHERDEAVSKPSCSCSSAVTETTYTLRAYRDVIGVFDCNDNLIRVLNVYRDALSASDQAALEKGIRVSSMEEALRLIAAYS